MLSPYDGTLGMLTDLTKTKTELIRYLINATEPLNYEIIENNNVRVVCILGKNEEELNLPKFNHPLIFKDIKGNQVVAADFRLYTKKTLDDVYNVEDALLDKINGRTLLHNLIFTKLMVEKNNSPLNALMPYLSEMFGAVMDTLISMSVYDKTVTDPVHIMSMIHLYTMDETEIKDATEAINRLPMLELKKLLHGNLKYIYDAIILRYQNGELKLPSKLISELVDNIKLVSDNPRLEGFNVDILVSLLSKTFFLLNNKELSIAMTEHKPTLISIIYTMLTEGIGSKTMLRKIIQTRKYVTKPKMFTDIVEQTIKDNTARV